jgi:hypothetical protein
VIQGQKFGYVSPLLNRFGNRRQDAAAEENGSALMQNAFPVATALPGDCQTGK